MIEVSVVDARGRAIRAPGLARWLARVAPAAARGEVTVALVPDARLRKLNRQYRRRNYATDVLAFHYEAPRPSRPSRRPRVVSKPKPPGGPTPLGDIVIARGVAERQAREQGHAVATELKILALHGLLHLLGYDHEVDSGQMTRLERRLRRKGGVTQALTERE